MNRHIARLEAHPPASKAPDLPSFIDRGAPPPPPQTVHSAGIDTRKLMK